jgi:hypothetical protein
MNNNEEDSLFYIALIICWIFAYFIISASFKIRLLFFPASGLISRMVLSPSENARIYFSLWILPIIGIFLCLIKKKLVLDFLYALTVQYCVLDVFLQYSVIAIYYVNDYLQNYTFVASLMYAGWHGLFRQMFHNSKYKIINTKIYSLYYLIYLSSFFLPLLLF